MEEFFRELMSADALGATVGSFCLILVFVRCKVPLSIAVLVGGGVLGALFGLSRDQIALAALRGMFSPGSIGLASITVLLLGLSQSMRGAGQLAEIVKLAKSLLRRPAIAMGALPALIGLLPMPGGALFSAPMVESAAGEGLESAGRLSAINYWYRHIWEHWWPLYPGVLLAVDHTGWPLDAFVLMQIPLGVFMFLGGLVIFRGLHPDLRVRGASPPAGTKRRLLWNTSSIWIVPLIWGAGTAVAWTSLWAMGLSRPDVRRIAWLSAAVKYGPLIGGLVISLLWTSRLNGTGIGGLRRIFAKPSIYGLVFLVLSIMAFQRVLKATDAGKAMGDELQAMNVAVVVVVAALPFISGMVTGLAIGFVGISFPIIHDMVTASKDEPMAASYMVLAYACGHIGMMLTPLHVCHVVSNKYFETPFAPVYKRIIPAACITLLLGIAYFFVLRALGM
ncbi:MAG: DUF401 family protein [Phycisphaerae bacterium]|jgi:hypothetical protein|nr:DUF401 family protein [Phycisphaerae bacterium]